jgi:hypothetical protein
MAKLGTVTTTYKQEKFYAANFVVGDLIDCNPVARKLVRAISD